MAEENKLVKLIKSNIVVIPIIIAIIGATFTTLRYVINLTETVDNNRVQIEQLIDKNGKNLRKTKQLFKIFFTEPKKSTKYFAIYKNCFK